MKRVFFLAGLVVLFSLWGCTQVSTESSQTITTDSESEITVSIDDDPITTTKPQSGYALQDVEKHTTSDDCRTIIDGKIYDVSSFSSEHPGGPNPILSVCGKDGTATFNGKHTMNFSMLQKFFVADLK